MDNKKNIIDDNKYLPIQDQLLISDCISLKKTNELFDTLQGSTKRILLSLPSEERADLLYDILSKLAIHSSYVHESLVKDAVADILSDVFNLKNTESHYYHDYYLKRQEQLEKRILDLEKENIHIQMCLDIFKNRYFKLLQEKGYTFLEKENIDMFQKSSDITENTA